MSDFGKEKQVKDGSEDGLQLGILQKLKGATCILVYLSCFLQFH